MIPTLSYHVILKAQNQRQHSFFIHCSASPKLTRSWQGPSCSKHLRGHLTPRSVVYSQLKRDSTTCFLKCPLPPNFLNPLPCHKTSRITQWKIPGSSILKNLQCATTPRGIWSRTILSLKCRRELCSCSQPFLPHSSLECFFHLQLLLILHCPSEVS